MGQLWALGGATGEIALGRGLALGHHDDRGGAAAEQRAGLLVRDLPHARCARRPRRMATPSADPECLPTFCNQIACSSSCCSPTATLVARRCRCLAHTCLCVRARAPLLVSSLYVYAVSTHEQLVSKSFQGRHGRAFLFTTATNVMLGPKEERILMTGLHSVADIYCTECSSRLGWKYLEAFESRHDAPASHIMMTPRRVTQIAAGAALTAKGEDDKTALAWAVTMDDGREGQRHDTRVVLENALKARAVELREPPPFGGW